MVPQTLTDEELNSLLAELQYELQRIADTYAVCEESAISVATICIKTAIAIMRSNLSDEETAATLRYTISQLGAVEPLITRNIVKH